jgi:anhydro-N-acetylmuramic acid kinase
MIYRTIGLMSGSSLDGLDIAYCVIEESGGVWKYEMPFVECVPFGTALKNKLENIVELPTKEFVLLNSSFGKWMGEAVNNFIEKNNLHFQIALICSHGHTAFHIPDSGTTVQIGCGATIAATTNLPVVSDLRTMDVALGGQGAPIVPIAEQLLFPEYNMFLNIGGISNITFSKEEQYIAFDICSANRVLNNLCVPLNCAFDTDGNFAKSGVIHEPLVEELNNLAYYKTAFPKSLANEFGTQTVMPIIEKYNLSPIDNLATYTKHIAVQIASNISKSALGDNSQILVTGGGALNVFLIKCIQEIINSRNIKIIVPSLNVVQYKESLAMALIGVLRWREEINILHTVTGASRSSIGGAMHLGRPY